MTMKIAAIAAALAAAPAPVGGTRGAVAPAAAPRSLVAVPLGDPTSYEFNAGYWEKAEDPVCAVDPKPQCKYKSWTLCNITDTYWCAAEDFGCKTDLVGCVDEDGGTVELGSEEECEEPDNKCGSSYCGTSPAQDDCQCDADECFAVVFVESAARGLVSPHIQLAAAASAIGAVAMVF